MIIIEGPDGSGKTSLIQKLSSKLGYEIAPKAVGSDAQELTDLRRWVDRSLDGGWQPVLYDRHALISEGIYGPAWNGQVREPFQDNYWLCLAMARFTLLRPTIIYCLPPVETVVENIRKDPHNDLLYPVDHPRFDKYKVPKSVGQIYWQYHWRACQELTALVYDYTRDDVNSVVDFIQATAQNKGY